MKSVITGVMTCSNYPRDRNLWGGYRGWPTSVHCAVRTGSRGKTGRGGAGFPEPLLRGGHRQSRSAPNPPAVKPRQRQASTQPEVPSWSEQAPQDPGRHPGGQDSSQLLVVWGPLWRRHFWVPSTMVTTWGRGTARTRQTPPGPPASPPFSSPGPHGHPASLGSFRGLVTQKCVTGSASPHCTSVTSDEALTPTPGSHCRPGFIQTPTCVCTGPTHREPQHVCSHMRAHTHVPAPGLTPLTAGRADPLPGAVP